jgi:hypothetical protein
MATLPPRVPTDLATLDQAIMLLGNRSKNSLTDKPRKQLIELIGVYPDAPTAARWKAELRQIRKELKEEGPEADESELTGSACHPGERVLSGGSRSPCLPRQRRHSQDNPTGNHSNLDGCRRRGAAPGAGRDRTLTRGPGTPSCSRRRGPPEML